MIYLVEFDCDWMIQLHVHNKALYSASDLGLSLPDLPHRTVVKVKEEERQQNMQP